MRAYTTAAVVLRRINYGETDKILTLYSRDRGRFSAIAKGARKAVSRLSGATELLTLTKFGMAAGKSLEIVSQAEIKESFPRLRGELPRLAHAIYLADLVDHSVEDHEPNPLLYDLLVAGLYLLQRDIVPEITARWFEVQFIQDLGYAPNYWECSVCGEQVPGTFPQDEIFGLSTSQGAVLCPRHARPASVADHSALTYESVAFLQTLTALGPDEGHRLPSITMPSTKSLNLARLALRRFIRYRLERDLKSLDFLDSLSH